MVYVVVDGIFSVCVSHVQKIFLLQYHECELFYLTDKEHKEIYFHIVSNILENWTKYIISERERIIPVTYPETHKNTYQKVLLFYCLYSDIDTN